jgi:formylglycine-generating enzyme
VKAWNGGWLPAMGSGKHAHLNGALGLANAANDAGLAYEPGWVPTDDRNIVPTDANLRCGASSWTTSAGSEDGLPINCINWYEAYAFCIWDGGFLPSNAKWEYAAAGGSQQREYPWGPTDPGKGNQYAIYDCDYPDGSGVCTGLGNIAPVGTASMGAGLWGQLDLAGNVDQWTLDWYGTAYVGSATDSAVLTTSLPEGVPEGDGGTVSCSSGAAVAGRVIRGGDIFSNYTVDLGPGTFPNRSDCDTPTDRSGTIGLRCARTP